MHHVFKLVQTSILLLHFSSISLSLGQDDYYTAAVVEYNIFWSHEINPEGNFYINALETVNFMKKASKYKVDIIVFPEIGLLKNDKTIFIEIPDPKNKITPADSDSYHPVLKLISAAARTYRIYTVINVHESYKNKKFNTDIVFDRSGTIIARYRKFNLYGEKYLNHPEFQSHVYFDTDFGTRFGIFTCFDILFKEPATGLIRDYNITDIVYPTAWYHELPFLTAMQAQSSWAYINDVNLLAANHNDISVGGSGSGLYRGLRGKPLAFQTIYKGSTLLIGKMNKKRGPYDEFISNEDIIFVQHKNIVQPWIQREPTLDNYETELISPDSSIILNKEKIVSSNYGNGYKILYQVSKNICHNELCCDFEITFTNIYYSNLENDLFKNFDAFYHYYYRMAVFDGIRSYSASYKRTGQQICSIIPCLSKDLKSCGLIVTEKADKPQSVQFDDGIFYLYSTSFNNTKISGVFSKGNTLFLPDILHASVSNNITATFGTVNDPKQLNYKIDNNNKVNLIFESEKLITGGIYARIFDRDFTFKNNSTYCYPSLYILLFVSVIYFYMT